jgi:transcriptional regulator with XRE-family HTH domain
MSNTFYIRYCNEKVTFGERFKLAREEMGLTQEDFSALSGVSRQTVSQVERERQSPSFETILAYGRHTKRSVDWLVLGDKRPTKETKNEPRQVTPTEALSVLEQFVKDAADMDRLRRELAEARAEIERLRSGREAEPVNSQIVSHDVSHYRRRRQQSERPKGERKEKS